MGLNLQNTIRLSTFLFLMMTEIALGSVSLQYSLGLNLGLGDKRFVSAPEIENSGYMIEGNLGVNLLEKEWLAFGRIGFHYDLMEKDSVEVETKAFYLDLAWNYRFNENWSLGPLFTLYWGSDVSFSDVGTNSDDNPTSLFLGPMLAYDFTSSQTTSEYQIGLSYNWDLDIEEREVHFLRLHLSWFFGGDPKEPKIEEPPVINKTPAPKVVAEKPKEKEVFKLNLESVGVNFASGSSELKGKSLEFIISFIRVLEKYESEWEEIRVEGHTDSMGNPDYNKKLSMDRADSVANLFRKNFPNKSIQSGGFGSSRPLSNLTDPESLKKNRRVEIMVQGEITSKAFIEELNKLRL